MIPALLAVALAAGPRVAVEVLARQAPRSAIVRGAGATWSVAARGDVLLVDGRAVHVPAPDGRFVHVPAPDGRFVHVPAPDGRAAPALALPPGRWRVELPGAPPRVYAGALALRAEAGIVRVRAELDLEPYVAGVVASEAAPDTPPAALEALAVVARSYALAARGRHADGALCDLAHCQLLRADAAGPHRAAAARAARATAGEVLVLPSGELAVAVFHAACGGHTADPREAFGSAASGAAGRLDPGCVGPAWSARLAPEAVAGAVPRALAEDPRGAAAVPPALRAADVVLLRGAGGWVARAQAADEAWQVSGDAFARALDAARGRGHVLGARLDLEDADGSVVVRGAGHGHGVGLCQAGAARWARQGEDRRAILARYFPSARVEGLGPAAARATASSMRSCDPRCWAAP